MLLLRSSRRYLQRHPWLVALSVLGVALGVAVVVAIDLANASARQAFALSSEAVTGTATHQIVPATQGGLDPDLYRRLRVDLGLDDVAPVVEGYATVPRLDGRTFTVLGLDPFAEAPFRPYIGGPESGFDLADFLTNPDGVLLAEPTAEAAGIALGDTLGVRVGGIERVLEVIGLMAPADERSRRATESLFVMDVAAAQELFEQGSQLSRIDLLIPDDAAGTERLARIEAALPEGAVVQRSSARTQTVEQMTRAFNLNLTALSLLALVVGMFLIYNTMTFSVVQRRTLIGQLRALGVTRRQVGGLVIGEALAIGLVGTALGLALGVGLGRGLVRLVTQTINDLYYVVTVRDLALTPWTLLKGLALGLGATVLATLPPAREATRTTVSTVLRRSVSESRLVALLPRLTVSGIVLGGVGAVALALPSRSIALSYGALLLVILGFALVAPAVVAGLSRAVRPVMGRFFGVLGRMAARAVVTTLSRTAVAVAALMVAVAATVGVGVMVSSFRTTVVDWLGYALQADVYVQAPSLVYRKAGATLDPAVVERLRTADGVAAAYTVRSVDARTSVGPATLNTVETDPANGTYRFQRGDAEVAWPAFFEGAVFVSEPFSYRTGVGVGDTLQIRTDQGERPFPVAAVFYDYGDDQGSILMARGVYDRFFEDRAVNGIALVAAPGQDVDALIDRMRRLARGEQEVIIRSNRALRETSLEIFDRTFTITNVLRMLAVAVAFIGVLSALMALQLERSRETAVLRANGLTPGQVWRYVTMQTGLTGLFAGFLAVPLGLVLAYVLIFVINKRSFGWTLRFEVAPEILVQAVLLALVAAILAGLYPSKQMAEANPSLALREE